MPPLSPMRASAMALPVSGFTTRVIFMPHTCAIRMATRWLPSVAVSGSGHDVLLPRRSRYRRVTLGAARQNRVDFRGLLGNLVVVRRFVLCLRLRSGCA